MRQAQWPLYRQIWQRTPSKTDQTLQNTPCFEEEKLQTTKAKTPTRESAPASSCGQQSSPYAFTIHNSFLSRNIIQESKTPSFSKEKEGVLLISYLDERSVSYSSMRRAMDF